MPRRALHEAWEYWFGVTVDNRKYIDLPYLVEVLKLDRAWKDILWILTSPASLAVPPWRSVAVQYTIATAWTPTISTASTWRCSRPPAVRERELHVVMITCAITVHAEEVAGYILTSHGSVLKLEAGITRC
jgi:hypothetical protein